MSTRQQMLDTMRRKREQIALCCRCKEEKPWSEFDICPSRRPFGLSSNCRPCDKLRKAEQKRKKYGLLTDEQKRKYCKRRKLKNFKLTEAQYDKLVAEQNGDCAICKQQESMIHAGSGKQAALAVDHDHTTGAVRGLLCTNCNRGLGMFKDDMHNLMAAATYLHSYNERIKDAS